jgi:hypothetical protein
MFSQNQPITMSAAATIHPIVLWSDRCQGNLYLAGKNTFLEFYTDENKVLKSSALSRSASADSIFNKDYKRCSQSTDHSTATPTNRSSSPSDRSMLSNDKEQQEEVIQNANLQSPGTSPREDTYHMSPLKKSVSWADVTDSAGHRHRLLPQMTTPPFVNEPNHDFVAPSSAPTSPYANESNLGLMAQCVNQTNHGPMNPPMNSPMNPMSRMKKAVSWADVRDSAEYDNPMAMMTQMMPMPPCVDEEIVMAPMNPIKRASSWADVTDSGGYTAGMMPMSPGANKSQKDMQPRVVKPRDAKGEALTQVKPAKKQDLKKLSKAVAMSTQEITTIMMRGIPCSFSQEALMSLIDEAGLKNKYNFFYLPRDGNRGSNLGYAFINFVDEQSADFCTATFKGVPLAPTRSMKTCTISPADVQGLTGLRKHFCRTAVSRGSRGPVFLEV